MQRFRMRASAAFDSARRETFVWKYQLIAMRQYPSAKVALSAAVTQPQRGSRTPAKLPPMLNQPIGFICATLINN